MRRASAGALAVFSISPVLTTPNLGTPSAVVLTNATGLPTAGLVDAAVTLAQDGESGPGPVHRTGDGQHGRARDGNDYGGGARCWTMQP